MRQRFLAGLLSAALGALLPAAAAGQVVQYYHLDAPGNVRAVTDAAGQVVERHDYLPFGEEWCPAGDCGSVPHGQPRRFAGKERDSETGFDYFGARYYRSGIGRFTTTDPFYDRNANLADPQRWNRYAYAKNNPLRFVDPNGEDVGEAAAWVQGRVSYASSFYTFAAVKSGSPALAGSVTFVSSSLEIGINGFADMFRVGESTGAALGRGDTGLAFAAAVSEDAGRAGGLILLGLSVAPKPPPAGAEYFKPGPFAGEGTPVSGPGRLKAAAQRGVNAEGAANGCHTCGAPSPGTRSGQWIGDHQRPSSLNPPGAAQRAYPHCANCSTTQGYYLGIGRSAPPASAPPLAVPRQERN